MSDVILRSSASFFKAQLKQRRIAMGAGNRKRTQTPKRRRMRFPMAIEKKYAKYVYDTAFRPYFREARATIRENYNRWKAEQNPIFDSADHIRKDEFDDEMIEFMNDMELILRDTYGDAEDDPKDSIVWPILTATAAAVFLFNEKQWNIQSKTILGESFQAEEAWWPGARDAWSQENYFYMRGYSQDTIRNVNGIVSRGVANGSSLNTVMGEIRNLDGKAGNRSRLLARDQIGKLTGKITQLRNQELGIDRYTWFTAADERVRTSHRPMNIKVGRWDNSSLYSENGKDFSARPGSWVQLHPGIDINCRCTSAPFLDDLMREIDQEIEAGIF